MIGSGRRTWDTAEAGLRVPGCPACGGQVWAGHGLVVEPGLAGEPHVHASHFGGPTRWTCPRCGYGEALDGPVSILLAAITTDQSAPGPPGVRR